MVKSLWGQIHLGLGLGLLEFRERNGHHQWIHSTWVCLGGLWLFEPAYLFPGKNRWGKCHWASNPLGLGVPKIESILFRFPGKIQLQIHRWCPFPTKIHGKIPLEGGNPLGVRVRSPWIQTPKWQLSKDLFHISMLTFQVYLIYASWYNTRWNLTQD